jgi:hypothetical protein
MDTDEPSKPNERDPVPARTTCLPPEDAAEFTGFAIVMPAGAMTPTKPMVATEERGGKARSKRPGWSRP